MSEAQTFTPHTDKQEHAIFSEKEIVLCCTGLQWGKGLPKDGLVLTPEGYRCVDTIRVGDELIDRNGLPTAVVGVYPQGVQPCYRISFTDRKSIITDAQHLNVIQPRHGREERVISTRDLYQSNHLWQKSSAKARVPALLPVKLPTRMHLIPPYLLGALIGDGNLDNCVGLSSGDQEILDRVKREIAPSMALKHQSAYDYRIVEKTKQRDANGFGYSRYTEELRRLGLWGSKSNSKFVPDEYKFAALDQRLDVLRGLMDTDGTVEKNKKMEFYTVSEQLANDVIWLVESLGGKAWKLEKPSYYTYKGDRKEGQLCYRVNIISKEYNPFYLPRKAEKYFKHENTNFKVIDSIEPAAPRETICFAVASQTSTFVANDQIVTHNTSVGGIRTKIATHTFTDPRDNFIVAAPTYKIMQQSTLPWFLHVMAGSGEYKKGDQEFDVHGGGTIYLRTGTDPDSVVGVTNVRHIWGDEAGKFSRYFWENLLGRAALKNCPITLTTTPYSLNWVFKDLVKPWLKGDEYTRERLHLCRATSKENPYFPDDVYEKRKREMSPQRFAMMYGGEFGKMEGLVFDCFDDRENVIEPFQLPTGTEFFAGVDWGHTHPFIITVRAITPSGNHIQVSEFGKTKLTLPEMANHAKRLMSVWGISRFYCGPDRPENILYFQQQGIPAMAANNDVQYGIDLHYELIKTRRYKVFAGSSPNTIDEYETYHWQEPKDLKPDDDDKEAKNPVKQDDDYMDANRYCTVMTYRKTIERRPIAIAGSKPRVDPKDDDNPESIAKRIRKTRRNPRTENFS